MTKKQIAFTLIELLVVIAIIGILSGLIIVTMSGITKSANIAKSKVFSNSLRNALIMNLVSEWKFDDVSGTTAVDSWSGGNNGTLVGFSSTAAGYGDANASGWMSSTNCISGTCLKFGGQANYVDIGNKSIFDFGLSNFTVATWIKVLLNNQASGIIAKTNNIGGNDGWYLCMAGNNKYAFRVGNGTTRKDAQYDASDTNWHYVVGVRDGDIIVVYYDGIRGVPTVGAGVININSSSYSLSFGQNLNYGYLNGSLDEIRIYNAAVPTSQIKEQYYAGLNKLLANREIVRKEYFERLNNFELSFK